MSCTDREGRKRRGKFFALLVAFLIAALLTSCAGSNSTTTTPGPVSVPSGSVKVDLGLPQKAVNAPVIGTVPDDQKMHINLTFNINPQAMNQLSNNDMAKAGISATANEVAQKIGIDAQTYQRIKSFFDVDGAKLQLSAFHTDLTIDTNAGTLSRLLHTRFVLRQTGASPDFYTPDFSQPPVLPAAIASSIEAVTGLDNYTVIPKYHADFSSQIASNTNNAHNTDLTQLALAPNCINYRTDLLIPSRIAHAYGYDQLWQQGWQGQGRTINILGFDGVNTNDLDNYFYCAGFKGQLTRTAVDKQMPQVNGGESTLDVEMAASVAPASHIALYVGNHSAMGVWDNYATLYIDMLQRVIDDNATRQAAGDVVSLSWGNSEISQDQTFLKALDQRLWILTNVEHMTVFAAAGDCGAFDNGTYNTLSVDAPASNPWAVAVGGTKLTLDSAGNRSSEVVWSDGANTDKCNNRWGGGGGVSTQFAQPTWQQGTGTKNQYSTGKRQLPDVSAVAYDLPVYNDGRWMLVNGTSAATPIWAANMALVNQSSIAKAGSYFYGPRVLYNLANSPNATAPFNDITSGTDLYYRAAPGWDYASGLGSPNTANIYTSLLKKA